MELWIRSQDKKSLVNTKTIEVCDNDIVVWDEEKYDIKIYLGKYKTQERALEVLDEIQSKLKATFLMKPKDERFSKYFEDGKRYLEDLNGICVVTGDRCFDLEPINKDIYVYEMPKE